MKSQIKKPQNVGPGQFPDEPNFYVPLGKGRRKRKRDNVYFSFAILLTLTLVVILGIIFSRGDL